MKQTKASRVVLIDNIGTRAGMDQLCDYTIGEMQKDSIEGIAIYPGSPHTVNFHLGSRVVKMFKFLFNLISEILFLRKYKPNRVYLNYYGTLIDRVTLKYIGVTDVVIHEFKYLDARLHNKKMRIPRKLRHARLYVFSEHNMTLLESVGLTPFKIAHPIMDEFNNSSVSNEGLLLAGNIRKSKGYIEFFELVKSDPAFSEDVLIVGIDRDNMLDSCKSKYNFRHIPFVSKESLNEYIVNCKYLVLPYIIISQSGILDKAIGLGKKCICSDIPYFINLHERYPDLIEIYDRNSYESFRQAQRRVNSNRKDFIQSRAKYIEDNNYGNLWRLES